MPILHAIHNKDELWDENPLRTTHPLSPHQEANDIWIFFNEIGETPESVVDDIKVIPYRAWRELPQLRPVIFDLMRRVEGTELGRVIITKLKPGCKIPPHQDQGAPVEYYKRFQIVLQSYPGCVFKIEDEQVQFRAGEVWQIANDKLHGVINNSAEDRLVIVADIRTC